MLHETANYGGPVQSHSNSNLHAAKDISTSLVRDNVSLTENHLNDIHKLLELLEQRLDTGLTPTPPMPAGPRSGGETLGQQPVSHLVSRLVNMNDGFNHAKMRLADLIARIEL